ncbi:o-succinylbenzoate synthase [Pradoshia sp.]
MKLTNITLHYVQMKLKNPFTNSFSTVKNRSFIIIEAITDDGMTGWGECVAFDQPWYTEETIQTCSHILKDVLIPTIIGQHIHHPDELSSFFSPVRRNPMAKSALEGAVWDLYAKQNGLSLSAALGGGRKQIEAGISIGLKKKDEELFAAIDTSLAQGYKRIKLKIKPGQDISLISKVRDRYPGIPIMADANSSYTLADMDRLRELDQYGLMMIEQPLAYNDLYEHALLQKELKTKICLDESIQSAHDALQAIRFGSCRVINLKIGRVGGLSESLKILKLCEDEGIDVWCGGMLETGISRAHTIALASMSAVNLPGDISSTQNYWHQDITAPEVTVSKGCINVPDKPGIGFELNRDALEAFTVRKEHFHA